MPNALQVISPLYGMISGMRGKKKAPMSAPPTPQSVGSYKRGGKVRRSGRGKVHKGERVLTKKQSKYFGRKRRGGKRR